MIKMTIATDAHGNVLGAIQHDNAQTEIKASGAFGHGAILHDVEMSPDNDMRKVTDAAKFHAVLAQNVAKLKGR